MIWSLGGGITILCRRGDDMAQTTTADRFSCEVIGVSMASARFIEDYVSGGRALGCEEAGEEE